MLFLNLSLIDVAIMTSKKVNKLIKSTLLIVSLPHGLTEAKKASAGKCTKYSGNVNLPNQRIMDMEFLLASIFIFFKISLVQIMFIAKNNAGK